MTKRQDLEQDAAARLIKVLQALLSICEEKIPAEAKIAQLTRILKSAIEREERKHGDQARSDEQHAAQAVADHADGSGPKVQ